MTTPSSAARLPLRIAVVANTSWYLYNFRRNLMRALTEQGHHPVAVGGDGEYAQRLLDEGFSHRAVRFNGSGTHPWHELGTVRALRRVLAAERIDMVLSYTPKGNAYSALALYGRSGALVMNISGLGMAFSSDCLLAAAMRALYRLTLRRAEWVFFQNEPDMRHFLQAGLVSDARASRLPGSGVDLSAFQPSVDPGNMARAGGPVFLLVARLLWDKGVGEFAEAARLVKATHPSARFRLLGPLAPEHRAGVPQATIQAWVDAGTVEYAGAAHDVRPYLMAADCVVLPSVYREGVPRSLLEAAACARPVIATDSVGCRDTVDDGVSGFLCKPRDAADLARQMLRLLAMPPDARQRMGEAGRAKMAREFDETLVIESYRRLVSAIATGAAQESMP